MVAGWNSLMLFFSFRLLLIKIRVQFINTFLKIIRIQNDSIEFSFGAGGGICTPANLTNSPFSTSLAASFPFSFFSYKEAAL
jgi:hypothetical protein